MNLHLAIFKLNPTVVSIRGDVAYDAQENVVEYDLAAAEALVAANEYKDQRAAAYPSIQEQLDLLYWDKVNGTDNWEQAIAAVKAEYPKG
jgi:ribosome-interacting GTPase 1